jgi:hypothetical protein
MRRVVAIVVTALGWVGCGGDGSTTTGIQHPALVPASATLIHACKKMTSETTLTVYCPPAMPSGKLTIDSAGPFGTGQRNSYFLNALSPSLPHPAAAHAKEQGRPYSPPGHWLVAAWRPASELRSFLRSEKARPTATDRVRGVRETFLLAPQGGARQDAGHVIVFWLHNGVGYTVSLHDPTHRRGHGRAAHPRDAPLPRLGCAKARVQPGLSAFPPGGRRRRELNNPPGKQHGSV